MFTWIPIYEEIARKILAFEKRQPELLDLLGRLRTEGLKVIQLNDRDANDNTIPLAEIDPLTFFASFNRTASVPGRQAILKRIKEAWNLASPVPDDFTGIPLANAQNSWAFAYAADREPTDVPILWRVSREAVEQNWQTFDQNLFNEALGISQMGLARMSMSLFWMKPRAYLSLDKNTRAYFEQRGIVCDSKTASGYVSWMGKVVAHAGDNFSQISHDAYLACTSDPPAPPPPEVNPKRRYWTLSAGEGGEMWEDFYQHGIAAIGWDELGDLTGYKDKETLRAKLKELWPSDTDKKNDTHACWQFAHDIAVGDIIFAKQGLTKLLGHGVVDGAYTFDKQRSHYQHFHKVKWKSKGEWEMPEGSKMALKTLTDITNYPDFAKLIASKVGLEMAADAKLVVVAQPPSTSVAYWWLNANPKIWNFEETPVGERQTYTSHNEKGNKRQKYRYFQEAKPGDLVVGYVTSPQKEVVAVCKITKGLHQTENGEEIEFEKVEQFAKPITYETLQANPDLANSEPLINNQGSLFKLTEQEFDVIRNVIDDAQPPKVEIDFYDKKKAMTGLFLEEPHFDGMLDALKEKKNVVLQGAPGVGKTYVAKRLAYALIESNDPQRIEMIQFHQSYSYEDFIQGFRPTPKGHFDLKYGIFHQFCRRAQREEAHGKPYVFIIDEINRGNLSKIFGELMMLIESDKRGKEHAIPLTYSQDADEKFYIPENLHLIGMMNTADRSLAMVDYALRRRFRFITLRPEFSSEAFQLFLADAGAKPELMKKIVVRMNALNEVIAADTKSLGPGYQIGHSYFCPRNGIKPDDGWYCRVIESEIMPLIQEYWFDNEQKVKEQRSALLA